MNIPAAAPAITTVAAVQRACQRSAPLWSLADMVAVNPFVGYADEPMPVAAERVRRCLGLDLLPDLGQLRQAWNDQLFDAKDLAEAAEEAGHGPQAALTLAQALAGTDSLPLTGERVATVAAQCSVATGEPWADTVVAAVAGFLASQAGHGVTRWPDLPASGLWSAWRTWAQVDRTLSVAGLRGFQEFVGRLPADHVVATSDLLARLEVPAARVDDYVTAVLGMMPGWAGRLRQQAWHGDGIGQLPELAAILLACETGLAELLVKLPQAIRRPRLSAPGAAGPAISLRHVLLLAVEAGYRRRILAATAQPVAVPATRPVAQVTWCIDVRSEPMRRALESADPDIETLGFAGFFAITVALGDSPRCPVLLTPAATVHTAGSGTGRGVIGKMFGHLRRSAVGGFSYMETAGFLAFAPLIRETLGCGSPGIAGDVTVATRPELTTPLELATLPLTQRVAMAGGLLKLLGIATPARLLVLCGHDASTANNPQSAGLACGACGGHGGGLNARIAAALLNQPEVRSALIAAGSGLPEDTVALAAVHDTATDVLTVLDRTLVPASHQQDLARLEKAFATTTRTAAALRAGSLPGATGEDLAKRARHWAEVRPEWALAGNAAFIAARRSRTVGLNLGGRCFLNSYHQERDSDGGTLELILTAPVVVASWINLQYFASAVDSERLGSGRKTIHNPVGESGVLAGNHGDLAVGLAFESVHDGERLRHLPQRLQVVVEADTACIDVVVAKHGGLRDLIENGWIILHALDPHGPGWQRWRPGRGWVAEAGATALAA